MTEDTLNPQIRDVHIGVRELRKLKIYPLSMADQKTFGSLFEKVIDEYLKQTPDGPMDEKDLLPFAQLVLKLIGENMVELLKLITDLKEKQLENFFDDVTNAQMSDIVRAVYEENFEKPSKNLMSLVEVVKQLFPSERLLQPFLSDTDNMTSATSIDEAIEKED